MTNGFGGGALRRVFILLIVAFLAAGCGSGGGGSDDGGGGASSGGGNTGGDNGGDNGGSVDPSDVPGLLANGDINDDPNAAIYAEPDDSQVIDIYVTVKAPDGSVCQGDDPTTPDVDEENYDGCTLADLNGGDDPDDRGDIDGDDPFDPELSATVEIPSENRTFESDEMEVRGATSRLSKQKSYKIEFDDLDWHGMERLQLNKHPYDLSRIRNKLAFDLFKQIDDFPSLRTQFVHLYVTDEANQGAGQQDFGLFTNIEYMDDDWAENHGQQEESNIFKAEQFEFNPPTEEFRNADADSDEFEKVLESKGDNESTATLMAMLDAVNDENNNFSSVFSRYFHPDNFRTWLAVNILLSNKDTNSQNFYLYRPAEIDNFYFTPWDYDGAFDFYGQPGEGSSRPRWTEGVANWWNMPLVRRYIRDLSDGMSLLDETVETLKAGVLSPGNVQSVVNSYPNEVGDIATSEPDVEYLPIGSEEGSAEEIRQKEANALADTIDWAYEEYEQTKNRPMPVYLDVTQAGAGSVRLEWDPSYDIQGNALVYDVYLADAPDLTGSSGTCTADKESMPVLASANHVVNARMGLTGTSTTVSGLSPGRYYFQVVVRDSDGYCQSAFDEYEVEDNNGNTQSYYGIYAFDYDGNNVTYYEDQ